MLLPLQILPFLLLGIGVDDMFVIVNCLDATPDHAPVHQVLHALSLPNAPYHTNHLRLFTALKLKTA